MLFTYSSVDNYLREGGRLGFVITQSVFKTQGAGDGFRQLRYTPSNTAANRYLKPLVVHDLSAMQVFDGATNRTAVFVCEKTTEPFKYPVKYVTWSGPSRIAQDQSLTFVRAITTNQHMGAIPVTPSRGLFTVAHSTFGNTEQHSESPRIGRIQGLRWLLYVA